MDKNPDAVRLGQLARGKPKNYSEAERKKRADAMRSRMANLTDEERKAHFARLHAKRGAK